jgi:hypothetical protein
VITRVPYLSTSAPANGCEMPQTIFWIASANAKSAAEMPMSFVIGCMNRPRLCRMPMASDSITAAPVRIDTLCHWLSEG